MFIKLFYEIVAFAISMRPCSRKRINCNLIFLILIKRIRFTITKAETGRIISKRRWGKMPVIVLAKRKFVEMSIYFSQKVHAS
jgi:hypothetical protein